MKENVIYIKSRLNVIWMRLSKDSEKLEVMTDLLIQKRKKEADYILLDAGIVDNVVDFNNYKKTRKLDTLHNKTKIYKAEILKLKDTLYSFSSKPSVKKDDNLGDED